MIVDIAGQALDVFLHGPESAHKNSIVKTSYSHIHSHKPMQILKEMKKEKTAKCSTHQTYLPLLVLLLSSVLVGNFQEAWHLHHFGGLVTNRKHL